MNLLNVKRTAFRTILVVSTMSYCCLILYAYKLNFKKSQSYTYHGLEVFEIQHTPTPRLWLYHISGFHSAGIVVIPSIFQFLKTNIFLSKAIIVNLYAFYAFNAFYAFTTINAP
jgi:hypothetical protein